MEMLVGRRKRGQTRKSSCGGTKLQLLIHFLGQQRALLNGRRRGNFGAIKCGKQAV